MTPEEFVEKWRKSELKERSAAQEHFIDLCRVLGEETPAQADPKGEWYCFERGATKTTGGEGWADVWMRGCFGWEYKGKRKDLDAAYAQLQQYAVALENPPILVVCDMERFIVHTNWTNTVSEVHEFTLDDFASDASRRDILKWAMSDPERLKPRLTRDALTATAAAKFAEFAGGLAKRGYDPLKVAHFINRLVFCMFAEDVDLLPKDMFTRMLKHSFHHPDEFKALAGDLFRAMKGGGRIGFETVEWFNGGLFEDDGAIPLTREEIKLVWDAAKMDWAEIDPSIFGTLFERGLDPDKRSQLGAHYTSREKIMKIVDPVVVRPLIREWEETKTAIEGSLEKAAEAKERRPSKQADARKVYAAARRAEEKARKEAEAAFGEYMRRLRRFVVLDPACGSGNFLYLSLLTLKDLEHRVIVEAEALGLHRGFPQIGPESVRGIELNVYAAELARVTIWIGEIQWMKRNGYSVGRRPILRPLDNIEQRDAVIDPDGNEAPWPSASVIVGNPPFLGAKLMKRRLGKEYTETLRAAFEGRLAGFTDLVCYWFEKGRDAVISGRVERTGLVATSSIRGGTNRPVLDRICRDLVIFDAWERLPWEIEGARVEVSLICFAPSDDEDVLSLDGEPVANINPDLSTGIDLTAASRLIENGSASFLGIQKSGPHDVAGDLAREWMTLPVNPNGESNASMLRPYWNGDDLTGRPRDVWLIDFPPGLTEADAALYEAPFGYLYDSPYDPDSDKDRRSLREARATARDRHAAEKWWEPYWPRPEMRRKIEALPRYIATTETSEHRLFVWLSYPVLPDKNLIVVVKDDDVTFGILHSRFHEQWALRLGTSLEDRPRYTSTTTFASFPFPEGLTPCDEVVASDSKAVRIAATARRLHELRSNWLNLSDLTDVVPEVVEGFPDRVVPKKGKERELAKRTLTNLYNTMPRWLAELHAELDRAVATAYGWPEDISDDDALFKLLELNKERKAKEKV